VFYITKLYIRKANQVKSGEKILTVDIIAKFVVVKF